MPVTGLLLAGSTAAFTTNVAAFRKGLSDTGYVDGQNVTIEYHWLASMIASRESQLIWSGVAWP